MGKSLCLYGSIVVVMVAALSYYYYYYRLRPCVVLCASVLHQKHATASSQIVVPFLQVVRRNLRRLDEDVLDVDLLEALVLHIHESQPPGAILVFLPGK
jgi:hypothetical protein